MRALEERGILIARACWLAGYNRSNLYYRRKHHDDPALKCRMHELAQNEISAILPRASATSPSPQEGKVNYVRGMLITPATAPNDRWSLDFMHDRLANGRQFRALTVGDDFTKECLALEIAHSFGSADVIRVFEAIAFERRLPKTIRFDNGSEFTSHKMLRWAAEHNIELQFIQPGKPTQNANAESLNGRIRDELLNLYSFTNIFAAREIAEAWRCDFNENRLHSALKYQTPKEFAASLKINPSQLSAA